MASRLLGGVGRPSPSSGAWTCRPRAHSALHVPCTTAVSYLGATQQRVAVLRRRSVFPITAAGRGDNFEQYPAGTVSSTGPYTRQRPGWVDEQDPRQGTAVARTPEYAEYTGQQQRPRHTVYQPAYARPPPPPRPRGISQWAVTAATSLIGLLVLSFVFTLFKSTGKSFFSPQGKRGRQVNKNKVLVQKLDEYLPSNRQGLTKGVMRQLRFTTGFTPVEIFRKYLWYLLRERKFDQAAIDDVLVLRGVLGLTMDEVAAALKERAERIYTKFGNVMLDIEGMTKAGIERKATARALFSKLLYLAECEQLLPQDREEPLVDIPKVFGATTADTNKLRIVSLYDVDLDKLESQFGALEDE